MARGEAVVAAGADWNPKLLSRRAEPEILDIPVMLIGPILYGIERTCRLFINGSNV
jgi:hypothetical protein